MAVVGGLPSSYSRSPSALTLEFSEMAKDLPHLKKGMKCVIATALALLSAAAMIDRCAAGDVLVGRFDHRGTGANLSEKLLNTTNVNPARFGKLFSYEIEGFAY